MMRKIKILLFLTLLSACAKNQLYQKGNCTLTASEARSLSEIKEIESQIKEKSAHFDAEIKKGPVNLIANKNYQDLITLRSRYDEAINAFVGQLQAKNDNSTCLKTLFKEDLNFPELSDEK